MSEAEISPLARRLAEENNVDWRVLQGSGAGGKVVERDVLEFLARVMAGEEDVDPTPEPVPDGMEAWPEADVRSFQQELRATHKGVGLEDIQKELSAADRFHGVDVATEGAYAARGAVDVGVSDDDLGIAGVGGEPEDEVGSISEDIFLFDDEDEVAAEPARAEPPRVEPPASREGDLDDDLLIAGDDAGSALEDEDDDDHAELWAGAPSAVEEDLPDLFGDGDEGPEQEPESLFGSAAAGDVADQVPGAAPRWSEAGWAEHGDGGRDEELWADGPTAAAPAPATPELDVPDLGELDDMAWHAPAPAAEAAAGADDEADDEAGDETLRFELDEPLEDEDEDEVEALSGSPFGEDELAHAPEREPEAVTAAPDDGLGENAALEADAAPPVLDLGHSEEEWDDAIRDVSYDGAAADGSDAEDAAADGAPADEGELGAPLAAAFEDEATARHDAEGVEADQAEPFEADSFGADPAEADPAEAGPVEAEPAEAEPLEAEPLGGDAFGAVGAEEGVAPAEEPATPGDLPLVSHGTLLRRHVDLTALAGAQLAVGQELGEAEPLPAGAFLLRAAAKAAQGLAWGDDVALARLDRRAPEVRRVPDAAAAPFRGLLEALRSDAAGQVAEEGASAADGVTLVVADMSELGIDEAVLHLGAPVLTLGRILYDNQRGSYRSTLSLSGDVGPERGAALLARVAELLDAPVRLVL